MTEILKMIHNSLSFMQNVSEYILKCILYYKLYLDLTKQQTRNPSSLANNTTFSMSLSTPSRVIDFEIKSLS